MHGELHVQRRQSRAPPRAALALAATPAQLLLLISVSVPRGYYRLRKQLDNMGVQLRFMQHIPVSRPPAGPTSVRCMQRQPCTLACLNCHPAPTLVQHLARLYKLLACTWGPRLAAAADALSMAGRLNIGALQNSLTAEQLVALYVALGECRRARRHAARPLRLCVPLCLCSRLRACPAVFCRS